MSKSEIPRAVFRWKSLQNTDGKDPPFLVGKSTIITMGQVFNSELLTGG
jgi:hypothetical protein